MAEDLEDRHEVDSRLDHFTGCVVSKVVETKPNDPRVLFIIGILLGPPTGGIECRLNVLDVPPGLGNMEDELRIARESFECVGHGLVHGDGPRFSALGLFDQY